MNKSYSRINWENYPSDKTPLNENNLNKIDIAVDAIDDKVIMQEEVKATKIEVAPLIKEIQFNENNGIFTITRKNGSKFTIDTKLEKIAINFDYNPLTQKIILTLIDGTVQYIDLSALITEYEFLDTNTVSFFVDESGKVSAIVKEGSIEEKHLQPNYLAEIKVESAKAESAATAAETSKNAAATSASTASTKANEASTSATNASNSANTATQKAAAAATSATSATNSASTAETKASEASASATSAANSATSASGSAATATNKASAAATSATNAATSATNANTYAKQSQSYAVGGTGTRENEDSDNAKYYYEQAKHISQGGNGLVPMGTIAFENLPTSNIETNAMYNISNDFISDERFIDGGGIFYGKGNNVYYTVDGKWDVLAASAVTGVKGNSETTYRQGNVNITPSNIGALPKNGNAVSATKATQDENGNNIANTYLTKSGDTENNITSFSQSTTRSNINTGEKQSVIFGKIKKWFADIKNGAFHTVANNLTTTSANYVLDARQGKKINDKFGGMSFGIDSDGNYGYIKAGADTVIPFKNGSAALVWSVYGLSGGINFENTGRVTFTVLNYAASGNVGVYGTTYPTDLSNRGHLYGYVSTGAGVNTEQVVETPDVESYPYIVLYPIYAEGWSGMQAINACKIII